MNDDNTIDFYDENDASTIIYSMQAPFMTDKIGESSTDIEILLEENDKEYLLTITPSKQWLDDPEREFPVTLDPTVRTNSSTSSGVYINSGTPDTNYNLIGSTYKVGNSSGNIYCTLLKFALPSLPDSAMIINARLSLHVSSATNATNVEVHKIDQDFSPATVTWNNKPAFQETIVIENASCNYVSPYYNLWGLTTLVKDWYKNGKNYGMLLKTNDNNMVNFYNFLNGSVDLRPVIEITYLSKAGLQDYWTYHSMNLGRSGAVYINDCSGNLVYAHDDLTMNGSRMPVSLIHYYNSTNNTDIGYGTGWQLSYNQKVEQKTFQSPGYNDSQTYYVYTDGDGTDHYFGYDSGSDSYKDQSGLNITLKKNYDNTYTIINKKGCKLNFNTSGKLSSIIDNNGNTATMGYTGSLLTTITDGALRVTTLNYTNGKLTSITDPSARIIVSYAYTGSKLTTITYNDSKSTTFGYDTVNNKLNAVTGIDGHLIDVAYYPQVTGAASTAYYVQQLLYKNVDGTLGNQWNIVYGNNTTEFTDEIGRKCTYQFNSYGNTTCIIYPDHSAQYIKYVNDSTQTGLNPTYSAPDTTMNKTKIASKLQKTITNYLQNHNMELSSNIVWSANATIDSQGTASVTTENKYIGNQSLKISKTNNTGKSYYSQNVTNLTAGSTYMLGTPTKTYSYVYDSTWKDKLISFDGKSITYDSIGNPLTYNGWTYAWNMGRQLAAMSKTGTSISYKYNDNGIRTQKTINGVTTNYHLVGDTVTFETNGTDNIYYYYDANGKLLSMSLNGAMYYYLFNGQGDIIDLLDENLSSVAKYTYDSWGKLVSITGTLANTVGVKNPYRYRGYRYDTETGLYYLQSRYYNPEWGRFLNADTIDNSQPGTLLSFNLFAYCYNNPVNMADPNGDIAWWIVGGIVGAAAGGIYSYATTGKVDWRYVVGGALIGAGAGWAAQAVVGAVGAGAATAGGAALAKLGDTFGKLGTYVKNPGLRIDWGEVTSHGLKRMWERGVTTDMANSWVQNGKALLQSAGKYLFVTKDGVAVVNTAGELITTYTRADFDDAMMEVVKKLFGQ